MTRTQGKQVCLAPISQPKAAKLATAKKVLQNFGLGHAQSAMMVHMNDHIQQALNTH